MSRPTLPRALRLTKAALARAEADQSDIIQRLRDLGEVRVADRLERCQQARRVRQPGRWPKLCRSVACLACRRMTVRRWWRGFLQWLCSPDVSLVTIPLTGTLNLIPAIRRVRKGLRDIRDRAARVDPRWAAVAMAGMLSGDHLLMIVQHHGIDRGTLWSMLERRWPEVVVAEVGTVEPRFEFSVGHTVQLALQHRGIEPIRLVIPAQRRAYERVEFEPPMPLLV